MKKACRILSAILLFSLSASPARTAETQTREDRLGIALGSYVMAAEQIRAFQRSECAYAYPTQLQDFDEFLRTEILPAFPAASRAQLKDMLVKFRGEAGVKSVIMVNAMISAGKEKGTQRLVCEGIAGALFSTLARAIQRWNAAKAAPDQVPRGGRQ